MSAVYSKLHKARSSTGCSGFVSGSVDGSVMCVRKTSGFLRLHRGSRVVPRLGVTLADVAVVDDSDVTVRGTVDRGSDRDIVKHINSITRCVV